MYTRRKIKKRDERKMKQARRNGKNKHGATARGYHL